MSRLFGLLTLTILTLTLWSCRPELPAADRVLGYAPEKAEVIMTARLPQLLDKADWEHIRQLSFYKRLLADIQREKPELLPVFEDPAAAGIDLEANAHLALMGLGNEDSLQIATFLLPLADRKKLESVLNSLAVQPQTVASGAGWWQEGQTGAVWNDDVLIVVKGHDGMDVAAFAQELLAQADDPSLLAQHKDLNQYLRQDYDLGAWITAEAILQRVPKELLDALPGYRAEDLQQNYVHGYWRFEEGHMLGVLTPRFTKRLRSDVDLLFRDRPAADLTEQLPSQDLNGLISAAFDIPGMHQLLLEKLAQGGAKGALEKMGISYEQLKDALSGDIALAHYGRDSTSEHLVFVAGIRDEAAFAELIKLARDKQALQSEGEQLYRLVPPVQEDSVQTTKEVSPTWLQLRGDRFYLSSSRELVTATTQATESELLTVIRDLATDNRFAAVISPDLFLDENEDPSWLSGIRAFADDEHAELKLEMVDQSTNSLRHTISTLDQKMERDTSERN